MPVADTLQAAALSLLLAGFLFVVRWWVETQGKDRASRDRRIAIVLICASLVLTVAGVLLDAGAA